MLWRLAVSKSRFSNNNYRE